MKVFFTTVVVCFICTSVIGLESELSPHETYATSNRLFHIERSVNKNIVCYDFNLSDGGALSQKEPIVVYWINREEKPGQRDKLNYVQWEMAFGYKVVSTGYHTASIRLNAFKDRAVIVDKTSDNQYICKIEIDHQLSVLRQIYVKTKTSNSLQVEYVELLGMNLETGMNVKERIVKN